MVVEQDQFSRLDDPVWNALSTTHASFAEGSQLAKRYPVDIAPFAGTRDRSAESYNSLANLLGSDGTAALVSAKRPDLAAGLIFLLDGASFVLWTPSRWHGMGASHHR